MSTAFATRLEEMARAARAAARRLALLPTAVKDRALHAIADALIANQELVLAANAEDCAAAEAAGLAPAPLARLRLTLEKIAAMARDVRTVATLPDPVGEMFDVRTLPNGLIVGRRRVPLGVLAAIYESRPNVTVDIAVLCLKAGNACILRGGSEAIRSNTALARTIAQAAYSEGVPEGAIQFIEDTDRALVGQLLKMREFIDLLVPRGGAELIRYVAENATMPVLVGGIGVCHTYVDRAADVEKALAVVHNAKTRNYSICNALDTLLVHAEVAPAFLPELARRWAQAGIEMRCDLRALSLLEPLAAELDPPLRLLRATESDWGYEFLAPVAAVKVVDSLDEALEHIERYGTGHSDAIVTEDYSAAMRFIAEVDTAVVYVNASTQFTDGAQFGLGAEIIDSTQKTIARGPVGLREITTYKWVVFGQGHTRPL